MPTCYVFLFLFLVCILYFYLFIVSCLESCKSEMGSYKTWLTIFPTWIEIHRIGNMVLNELLLLNNAGALLSSVSKIGIYQDTNKYTFFMNQEQPKILLYKVGKLNIYQELQKGNSDMSDLTMFELGFGFL